MLARRCTLGYAVIGRGLRPATSIKFASSSMRVPCRRHSASAGGGGASAPSSPGSGAGALAPIVSELDRLAPSFDVDHESIRILQTPAEFYETLKVLHDAPGLEQRVNGPESQWTRESPESQWPGGRKRQD